MIKNKNNFLILGAIVFFVFIMCFLFLNKTGFYAQVGKFYLKRGAYLSAQSFLEKSYSLGNTDTDFRVMYVNSLVNSPLSIEAQERLVEIVQDDIQDSASASAEFFLHNLKKEIHNKYTDNYVRQAAYNQKIMHWGKLPITYTFKNNKKVSPEIVAAINDAFDTWERSSSARLKFSRVYGDHADIIIKFNYKKIINPALGQKYVIAHTTPFFAQDKLIKMEIDCNLYNLDGEVFTSSQFYNTALHEIFHALGFMGHSFEPDSVMYVAKNSNISENSRQILSEADKITLELFYKIKPDITNAEELEYEYIPYLIIGNNAEVNYIKGDEAKKYIKKAPNVPAGYIDYAQVLLNEKNYTASIAYLNKALRLAFDDETKNLIYYNLAVVNYYDGNYLLAQVYIDKAMEYKDDNDLQVLNAEIFFKQNKTEEAVDIYKNLTAKNPDNIDYALNLVNIYIKNKHYILARKVLKDYIKHNPKSKSDSRIKKYWMLFFVKSLTIVHVKQLVTHFFQVNKPCHCAEVTGVTDKAIQLFVFK